MHSTKNHDGPLGHMLAMVCNGLLGCMLATGYDELSSQRLAMDQQAVMDRYVLMDLSITCLLWP
ncbi:BnaA04g16930D [Brassica napus]|uniref:BnaA04g16930D protein n=1 Tax=Brassica napus TaxID=3708 RepID=A0A078H2L3_BRANA|nr:BnaA04g16930D [Brassica napus]